MKTRPAVNGLGKPIIFQIAGYSNSGKTTFITRLIDRLTAADNWKVVTLKHHGHGGKPEIPNEKDSARHIASGAAVSIVEGGGRIILHAEEKSWTLSQQIQLLSFFLPDLILIEGYKQEDFPKALLLREEKDYELLGKLTNVVAIFYWENHMLKDDINNLPCFHINDENGLTWLRGYLTSGFHHKT